MTEQQYATRIAFIGAGNMSRSIIGGLINSDYQASLITAANPSTPKLDALRADFSINTTQNNLDAIRDAEVVVLGVKPQMMAEVCTHIKEAATAGDISLDGKLFISLAVGITAERLVTLLGQPVAMIRCMPNTPSLLSLGVSGLYSRGASEQQQQLAEYIMKTSGIVVWVDSEEGVDAVAAVSGSGPAYFFLFMEGMVKKAIALGFSPEEAKAMVQKTAEGAAAMVAATDDDISQLRANVTSKGGTTAAALGSFNDQQLTDIIDTAMQAACDRAAVLAKELG